MTLLDHSGMSHLCELMELAAARLLRPQLRAGETSVAVAMKLRHVAIASGTQGLVRVSASQQAVSGRLHHFIVNAFDERGLIAVCEHTRAIVSGPRFGAPERRRVGDSSMSRDA